MGNIDPEQIVDVDGALRELGKIDEEYCKQVTGAGKDTDEDELKFVTLSDYQKPVLTSLSSILPIYPMLPSHDRLRGIVDSETNIINSRSNSLVDVNLTVQNTNTASERNDDLATDIIRATRGNK
jgi:hypothetical protein